MFSDAFGYHFHPYQNHAWNDCPGDLHPQVALPANAYAYYAPGYTRSEGIVSIRSLNSETISVIVFDVNV